MKVFLFIGLYQAEKLVLGGYVMIAATGYVLVQDSKLKAVHGR